MSQVGNNTSKISTTVNNSCRYHQTFSSNI